MSEMLGNYYFINGYYSKALEEYERENNNDFSLLIKLIFCSLKMKQYDKVLYNTYKLLNSKKISFSSMKKKINELPYKEIKYEIENIEEYEKKYQKNIALAVIYLFDDIEKSLKYFNKIKNLNCKNVTLIINQLQQISKEKENGNKKNRQKRIYN